jgi:hypothetical protein
MDERFVVERLRAMFATGGIPRGRPRRIFGGPGAGRPCAACERRIGPDESEVEVEFDVTRTLVFHPRCFQLLEGLRHEFL